jgi:hypothetical protein
MMRINELRLFFWTELNESSEKGVGLRLGGNCIIDGLNRRIGV